MKLKELRRQSMGENISIHREINVLLNKPAHQILQIKCLIVVQGPVLATKVSYQPWKDGGKQNMSKWRLQPKECPQTTELNALFQQRAKVTQNRCIITLVREGRHKIKEGKSLSIRQNSVKQSSKTTERNIKITNGFAPPYRYKRRTQ